MSKDKGGEYKEDSTKGKSVLNPLNYKGDVLVQVWMDSRVLATMTRWMDLKGERAFHMSQAVRRPLEVMVEFLVSSGDVQIVEDTIEAREMLIRRFNVDLNRGGRGNKNVLHNITLSDRRAELGKLLEKRRENDIDRPSKGNKMQELIDKAISIYDSPEIEERMKAIHERDKLENEELDRLINNRSELPVVEDEPPKGVS